MVLFLVVPSFIIIIFAEKQMNTACPCRFCVQKLLWFSIVVAAV